MALLGEVDRRFGGMNYRDGGYNMFRPNPNPILSGPGENEVRLSDALNTRRLEMETELQNFTENTDSSDEQKYQARLKKVYEIISDFKQQGLALPFYFMASLTGNLAHERTLYILFRGQYTNPANWQYFAIFRKLYHFLNQRFHMFSAEATIWRVPNG